MKIQCKKHRVGGDIHNNGYNNNNKHNNSNYQRGYFNENDFAIHNSDDRTVQLRKVLQLSKEKSMPRNVYRGDIQNFRFVQTKYTHTHTSHMFTHPRVFFLVSAKQNTLAM